MQARMRFYAELNERLPGPRKGREFAVEFEDGASIGSVVEACGVPMTEVDLILSDGEPASPADRAKGGTRIAAFPVFESFDVSGASKVRPVPLRRTRFATDAGLDLLAWKLQGLGLDVAPAGRGAAGEREDGRLAELARLSDEEQRIVLTLDRTLAGRPGFERSYCLRASGAESQLIEVLERFHLSPASGEGVE